MKYTESSNVTAQDVQGDDLNPVTHSEGSSAEIPHFSYAGKKCANCIREITGEPFLYTVEPNAADGPIWLFCSEQCRDELTGPMPEYMKELIDEHKCGGVIMGAEPPAKSEAVHHRPFTLTPIERVSHFVSDLVDVLGKCLVISVAVLVIVLIWAFIAYLIRTQF